jgi:hypothetical protein
LQGSFLVQVHDEQSATSNKWMSSTMHIHEHDAKGQNCHPARSIL